MSAEGILYIVATPIGNLEDITYRAVRMLSECDCIYAEDTKTSIKLLSHYHISKPMYSCNAVNETRRIDEIRNRLKSGELICIISDAGTPGISDPSVRIVSTLRSENFRIEPIPGPSALITALSAAGIPTLPFYFAGFPPQKKGRQTFFKNLADQNGTLILYESPYRILKTLQQILDTLGDRYIVIARELTKKFEEFRTGTVSSILTSDDQLFIKGEFVILIADRNFTKE